MPGSTNDFNRVVTIYVMADPRDKKIYYVGATAQRLCVRLQDHLMEAKRHYNRYRKHVWLRSLLARGLKPLIIPVEQLPGDQWRNREKLWLEVLLGMGEPLTNMVTGKVRYYRDFYEIGMKIAD